MQTAFSHRVSPTGRVWSSLPDLRHVVPHQLHLCRHRRRLEPVHGILDRFFGSSGTHDGPELVAIDPDSDGGLGGISDGLFGPLAVLLIGFTQHEVDAFRALMISMDGDMIKILSCTKKLLASSLESALAAPAQLYEPLPPGTRRAVVLSGMSGSEVQEVISAYADSGLPEALWAAAVPQNYQRRVSQLLEDIYGDHSYMMEREREAAALRRTGPSHTS